MSKRGFGLAGSIDHSCRIYYENIFSQFQIGRVVDLLCTIASDTGMNSAGFRAVVNAALTEACRYQGLFNSSMTSLEPVTVEYGSDPENSSIAVQFTVTEDLKNEFLSLANGAQPGEVSVVRKLGRGLTVKFNLESGRAEFQCVLPFQTTEDAAAEEPPYEFVQIDNSEDPEESENEYIELGDVEYERLLKANPGAPDSETGSNAKKIITAATSSAAKVEAEISQEMDQKLEKSHSKEVVTEMIASSASVEQTAETIKRNLDTEEITSLLAKGKPDNIADILTLKTRESEIDALLSEVMSPEALKAALTEEEILRLVKDRLTDDAKAKILTDSLSNAEMGKLLSDGLTDSEKASLLASSDLAEAGKLLSKALELEDVNRLIKDSLSDELKAKALSQELSQAEISELVSENLQVSDKARILAHYDPARTVALIKDSVDEAELARILAEQLTEEEQAELLMESLPSEVAAELLASSMTREEKARLLSKANPKFAAKVMKQMHTPEELAELIKESIPEEDQGAILSEGLDQEEISEILTKSIPKEQRARVLAKANPEAVAQVIRESASEESIEELIRTELPEEEIAKALAQDMPQADLARMVRGSVPQDELSRIIAGGLPEEEIARIFKGSMPEDELAQLVRGGIPEEELARIVKGSSSEEEVRNIIRGGADAKQIAETILSGSTPEQAAELLKSCFSDEQIAEAISTSLPAADIARAAAATLSPAELVRIARSSMPPEEFSKKIAANLTPEQVMNLTIPALKDADVAEEILSHFSSAELAEKIKEDIPSKVIANAVQNTMTEAQIVDILSSGLKKEEFAKVLTSALPRDSYAKVLANGLPSQEMARALSEGLPKDKFAQLVQAAVPKSIVSKSLNEAGYTSGQAQAAPTQSKLEPSQVAQLLNSDISRGEAMSVLATVLPKSAAEGMFTGAVPKADITQALQSYLPNPELAPNVATSLARFIGDAPSNDSGPTPHMSGDSTNTKIGLNERSGEDFHIPQEEKVLESSKKNADERAQLEALQAQQLAQLEKTLQGKIDEQKKAVEFYLARSRKLETQLKFVEDKERKAIGEAKRAKKELENILAATPVAESDQDSGAPETGAVSANTREIAEDRGSPAPADKAKSNTVLDAERKRDKEALKFFQKKAREFEGELRRSEGEIRRLNAEHTKELLKLAKTKEEKVQAARNDVAAEKTTETSQGQQSSKASDKTGRSKSSVKAQSVERDSSFVPERDQDKSGDSGQAHDSGDVTELRQVSVSTVHVEPPESSAASSATQPVTQGTSEASLPSGITETQHRALEAQLKQRDTQLEQAEAKLRKSAEEKSRLSQMLSQARAKAGQRSSSTPSTQPQVASQGSDLKPAPDETNPEASQDLETDSTVVDSTDAVSSPESTANTLTKEDRGNVAQNQVYRNRIRSLESKIGRLERALLSAGEAGSRAYAAAMAAEGERSENGTDADTSGASQEANEDSSATRGARTESQGAPDSENEVSQTNGSGDSEAEAPQAPAKRPTRLSEEEIDDVPQKIEEEVNAVDQDLTGIVKQMEKLKNNITDQPSKRAVDSLMSSIMQEKARLSRMTSELTTSIRKKELTFRNQEAMLIEEVRKSRILAEQKQSNVDRMRQQAQEMQLKFDREKASLTQSSSNDTQYRMRFEQGQRQIEMLNKEIEKANRRLQSNPGNQPSAAHQREALELRKMAETAGKALQAKKQELDTLKEQLREKDKRETEYKRALMKLQNELNQAKTAAKKAA